MSSGLGRSNDRKQNGDDGINRAIRVGVKKLDKLEGSSDPIGYTGSNKMRKLSFKRGQEIASFSRVGSNGIGQQSNQVGNRFEWIDEMLVNSKLHNSARVGANDFRLNKKEFENRRRKLSNTCRDNTRITIV